MIYKPALFIYPASIALLWRFVAAFYFGGAHNAYKFNYETLGPELYDLYLDYLGWNDDPADNEIPVQQ